MGRRFGDPKKPLLFSVRSGARSSMPGMMETVLNVGLTSKTLPGLIRATGGNERFAYDAYRRLKNKLWGLCYVDLDLVHESYRQRFPLGLSFIQEAYRGHAVFERS